MPVVILVIVFAITSPPLQIIYIANNIIGTGKERKELRNRVKKQF